MKFLDLEGLHILWQKIAAEFRSVYREIEGVDDDLQLIIQDWNYGLSSAEPHGLLYYLLDHLETVDPGFKYALQIKMAWPENGYTSMEGKFRNNLGLKVFPYVSFHDSPNLKHAFNGCVNLRKFDERPYELAVNEDATSLLQAFNSCSSLVESPSFNCPPIRNLDYTFNKCTALKRVKELNLKENFSAYRAFAYCPNLERIDMIRSGNGPVYARPLNNAFYETPNIKYMFIKGFSLGESSADLRWLTEWGAGSAENLQSLKDTLVNYSISDADKGQCLYISQSVYNRLTSSDEAAITAKHMNICVI